MTRARTIPTLAVLLVATGLLGGCYLPNMDMKKQTAMRLAVPNGMFERAIPADPYMITAFERVHSKNTLANVYIEGGPMVWDDFLKERETATPMNPLALHMSTRDLAPNVIWLARPCQFAYSPKIDGSACTREEWANGRFSLTNLRAMNTALDNIKKRHGITGFNLIGVHDGAGVAIHLAAARKDVKSLRTVAGMVDTDTFKQVYAPDYYETTTGKTSNNPAMHAEHLARIPQHHMIGEWDDVVGADMAQKFRQAAGNSPCIRVSEVKGVTHEKGWVNRWPDLLKSPLDCKAGMARSE